MKSFDRRSLLPAHGGPPALAHVRVALVVGPPTLAAAVYADELAGLIALPPAGVSLVARVDAHHPVGSGDVAGVPVFETLEELIASGIAVDLLLLAGSATPPAPLVRRALEQRWTVVCGGFPTYDEVELRELLDLAETAGRSLLGGPPSGALTIPPLVDAGADTRVEMLWTRPAGAGSVHAYAVQPAPLVDELAPWLVAIALPYLGGAAPLRVRARLSGRWRSPGATVLVQLAGGGQLEIEIAHDRFTTGPDTAGMRLSGAGAPGADPVALLTESHAMQLYRGIAAARGGTVAGIESSPTVLAVMRAAHGSIASGGRAVDVL
jgi:hypothetical protein